MKYYYKKGKEILILQDDEEKPSGYSKITEEECNRINGVLSQIDNLKFQLSKTDYQAIKFAEGWITAEEYAEMKAARQELRDQINQLESEL